MKNAGLVVLVLLGVIVARQGITAVIMGMAERGREASDMEAGGGTEVRGYKGGRVNCICL